MEKIEKIKRRINGRKNLIDINKELKVLDKNKTSNSFKILMSFMSLLAIFLSFAIYAKKDESAIAINSIFNSNINFSSFNRTLNKLINFRIVDNNLASGGSELVGGEVNYVSVGEDYYTSEGNLVIAQDDGVITYVNGKDDNYTIIVEYDCGVRATYNGVYEVNVYVNDRIYKEDILGSFIEKVEIIYIKNSEKLTYEEVLSII